MTIDARVRSIQAIFCLVIGKNRGHREPQTNCMYSSILALWQHYICDTCYKLFFFSNIGNVWLTTRCKVKDSEPEIVLVMTLFCTVRITRWKYNVGTFLTVCILSSGWSMQCGGSSGCSWCRALREPSFYHHLSTLNLLRGPQDAKPLNFHQYQNSCSDFHLYNKIYCFQVKASNIAVFIQEALFLLEIDDKVKWALLFLTGMLESPSHLYNLTCIQWPIWGKTGHYSRVVAEWVKSSCKLSQARYNIFFLLFHCQWYILP